MLKNVYKVLKCFFFFANGDILVKQCVRRRRPDRYVVMLSCSDYGILELISVLETGFCFTLPPARLS
jgi:hypothetical protein